MKERIVWIDFVKLLAIYLVVLGHVLSFMGLNKDEVMHNNHVWGYIYAFHMPLFMTVSGFFSHKLISCQGNIRRKFMQLIVPCISLGIVCLIARIHSLNFWYLKSLFICYVVWDLFFLLFRKRLWLGTLLLCIGCFLFFPLLTRIPYLSSYKVDFMLPFFGFGILMSHYWQFVIRHVIRLDIVFALLFITGLYFWDSSFIWYFSKPQWIDYKAILEERCLLVDMTTFWQSMWRYAVGLFGTVFVFLMSYKVNNISQSGGGNF